MPTMLPSRPERTVLAEAPAAAHRTITTAILATAGLGAAGVFGASALVAHIAGPMLVDPLGAVLVALGIGYSTLLTLGALAVGDSEKSRTSREAKPLSARRHHPATWATLVVASVATATLLRGTSDYAGEFQRVAQSNTPLGALTSNAAARPRDPLAQFALGVAYARAHRFVEADEPLRRATELAPSAGVVHEWYGWTRSQLGDPGRAVAEYRLAQANHDRDPSVEEGLVRNLASSGHAREAEAIARKHVAANPQDATWEEILGWSLTRQYGRTDEAIKAFEIASVYDHDDAWVEAMLGYEYRSKTDFKTALAHFARAYKLQPTPHVGYEIGATRVLACDLAGADSAFAATEKAFPKFASEAPAGYRAMRAVAANRNAGGSLACGDAKR